MYPAGRQSDHQAADASNSHPSHFDPRLLERLTRLNLGGRLLFDEDFHPGGAFGDIAKGRCVNSSNDEVRVAIKRLRFYTNEKERMIRLFEEEVYVWSKLGHINILPLVGYDIDDASGAPMLVSVWMDNGTAWQYVNSHSEADLLHLITGIARGIEYLHANKIIHSDIKSDNVLVSDSGDARICDFGQSRLIAASLSLANLSSSPKGTTRYLARELLLDGTEYSTQTDVWAFGMTAYELLTRERPYAKQLNDAQVFNAIYRRELPSFPPSWSPNLHEEGVKAVRNLCQSCWRFRAANRPAMIDVVRALEWQAKRKAKAGAEYFLRVIRLEDAQWMSELPFFYVELRLGNMTGRTGRTERNTMPIWNERFKFGSSDASVTVAIDVKESSPDGSFVRSIGQVEIRLGDLLDECACGEARLALSACYDGTSYPSAGVLYVHLKDADVENHLGFDIENARQTIQNTRRSASDIGSFVWQLDRIVKAAYVVSVRIQPYTNLAWRIVSAVREVASRDFEEDKHLIDIVCAMEETLAFARDPRSLCEMTLKHEGKVDELLKQIIECCRFVQQYTGPHRATSGASSSEYRTFFLDAIKEILDPGTSLGGSLDTRIDNRANNTELQQQLEWLEKQLCPNKMDTSKRPRCLPGTRREYLDRIKGWLDSGTMQNILWLNGIAGSGKSTIAASIMDHCDENSRLAAFLFFQRGKEEHDSIIRSIAYQLAGYHPSIARHIIDAVKGLKNITGALPERQFEMLILEPLKASAQVLNGPVVIILDALDECGSVSQRREILKLLKLEFSRIPLQFRFLVTSRPENDIMKSLSLQEHIFEVRLDNTSRLTQHDVYTYIDKEMREIDPGTPNGWSWDDAMKALGVAANGLFIWASTAVKLVRETDNPSAKLKKLITDVRSVGEFGLDSLYSTVLEQSGISWGESESRSRFTSVLGLILFGREALSGDVIENFLDLEAGDGALTLGRLRSVLSYEPGRPIRLHHASFADYLLSFDRSGSDPWFIDTDSQKKHIATRCFNVMNELLRFNICKLETSFVRNDDIEGLQGRIDVNIPRHLSYACRFWAEHVCQLPPTVELLYKLKSFAMKNLLYWFEVLSLTRNFRAVASRSLYDASPWIASIDAETSSFLWGGFRLASLFAYPISESAPHIYLTALSHWRGESRVAEHYSGMHPVIPVHYFGTKQPEPCIKVINGHAGEVNSVAFSPDGKRIASGSDDKTIRVWDADTGELVSGPFEGHTEWVTSVAFSPDGKRVASGSDDETIRVWDADTGELVSGPFEGHTEWVSSVAFSPDGKRVASGSSDKAIRVWDADTGELVSGPFEGHTGRVTSVAFSPDGKRVASGSADNTIRVWDADTGELVSGPFEGHTYGVCSVAFSPDGKRVASGSSDETIRVWDADTGELVSGPFEGHTGEVQSVAFSPDGKRVASGSGDETIRVWDADTGELVSGPFEGHTEWVSSVAFSPDGKRVASGSGDETIRVWDADTGELVSGPFEGHTEWVTSVAFSPDGKRVASGSGDETIRVWDADTGELVSGPFQGHTDEVLSVAFSPDGKRVASGSGDRSIRIWDADTGELVSGPFEGHTEWVSSVAFSPDGKRVASGSGDKTIRVWDAGTGELVSGPFQGHTDEVLSVAFSPDGKRVASGSGDRSIRVWDADTGELVSGPFEGHTEWVSSVAFSPDGKRVASGSSDKAIRVWDADTGELVSGPFEGHTSWVTSVAFSPDGKRVASGSGDKTIRVWDTSEVRVLSDHGEKLGAGTLSGSRPLPVVYQAGAGSSRQGVLDSGRCGMDKTLPKNDSFSKWTLRDDGWIVGEQGELLIWIPDSLRPTLWRPQNTAVFSCPFLTRLDFSDCPLGENWCEGFPRSQ